MTGDAQPTIDDEASAFDPVEVDGTVVELLAGGQHQLVVEAITEEMPGVDPVLAMLGALAREVRRTSVPRDLDALGVQALGAMVGGLFGIDTVSDDEVMLELHAAGARLAGRLRQVEASMVAAGGALLAVREGRS